MNTKEFWKSKTFWFNVLALLVAVAAAFGYTDFHPSAETEQVALVLVTIVNLVLRFYTSQGVRLMR